MYRYFSMAGKDSNLEISLSLAEQKIQKLIFRSENSKFSIDALSAAWQFCPLNLLAHLSSPCVLSHLLLALVAQSVERVLGKDEVGGSSPLEGSNL